MYGVFPPIEYQMMVDVSYRTERALQVSLSVMFYTYKY